jgi:3-oxoadipate enol-lactonase
MSTALVRDARVEFSDTGAGSPLVLLHGFPFSGAMWGPQVADLSKRCRVIVPDLPGLGQSEPVNNPHLARWADHVVELLEQLRVTRAVVAGLSMGGYVALAIARRHPSLVSGLILANSRAGADDVAARAKREELALAVLAGGSAVLVAELMPKLLAPGAPASLVADVAAMIRMAPPQGAADAARAMARRDDSVRLVKKLAVPLLAITGAQDALIAPEESERMASAAPQGRLEIIEGAGHLSNLEAPDRFNAAVRTFLRDQAR